MAADGVDPCAERSAERGPRYKDRAFNRGYGGSLLGASFCAYHVCGARVTPNFHVSAGVAHIVEARLGEMVGEKHRFVRPLEIYLAVAGVDFVKQVEIARNRLRQFSIGCRD